MTGRTVTRWIRFIVDDNTGVPREIPIDSISIVGFAYEETEMTAWQDKVKNYIPNQSDCPIEITGPMDTSPVQIIAGSGLAPVLSGSYTVLQPLTDRTFTTPLGLSIAFGDKKYWEIGDPVFGDPAPTPVSGFMCTKFNIEGEKYSARFEYYGS